MRIAHTVAGSIDFSKTGFIECYSTGMLTEDPIEIKVVVRVFREFRVHISSIKPNVGHIEGS